MSIACLSVQWWKQGDNRMPDRLAAPRAARPRYTCARQAPITACSVAQSETSDCSRKAISNQCKRRATWPAVSFLLAPNLLKAETNRSLWGLRGGGDKQLWSGQEQRPRYNA